MENYLIQDDSEFDILKQENFDKLSLEEKRKYWNIFDETSKNFIRKTHKNFNEKELKEEK